MLLLCKVMFIELHNAHGSQTAPILSAKSRALEIRLYIQASQIAVYRRSCSCKCSTLGSSPVRHISSLSHTSMLTWT